VSLSKLLDSNVENVDELLRNERSLWDVTSPHYSNARLARFLFLLLNAKCYQWNRRCWRSCSLLIITVIFRQTKFLMWRHTVTHWLTTVAPPRS